MLGQVTTHQRKTSTQFTCAHCQRSSCPILLRGSPRDLSSRVSRPFYIAFRGRQHLQRSSSRCCMSRPAALCRRGPRIIRPALFLASIFCVDGEFFPRECSSRFRRRPAAPARNCACRPAARPRNRHGKRAARLPPRPRRSARRALSASGLLRSCWRSGRRR